MAGNIRIIEPRENYQKVSKSVILNERVDALTMGVYVKVLCLGKKWELNIKGLAALLHVSADKIRASFSILEEAGYLRRTRVQDANGRFSGWDYEVSSAPLTDIAKTPTSVKSDDGKTPTSVKCPSINRDNISEDREYINKTKTDNNSKPQPAKNFDFRKALLDAGVEEEVADAWLLVRKTKRATNTKLALDAVLKEIAAAGMTPNAGIRLAAENSWQGFRAAWVKEETPTPGLRRAPSPRRSRTDEIYAHLFQTGRELGIIKDTPEDYDEQ